MICYRMKHLPTGLYFRPSAEVMVPMPNQGGRGYIKTNLSKKGKIYTKMPTVAWIKGGFYNHVVTGREIALSKVAHPTWQQRNKIHPYIQEDWVIEEVT